MTERRQLGRIYNSNRWIKPEGNEREEEEDEDEDEEEDEEEEQVRD